MPAARRRPDRDRAFRLTILTVAVVASMSLAQEFLKPLALAVLLAFVLAPPARFLERRRVPRGAAVACAVLLALGALGSVGYVVGRQMAALANDLPRYQGQIDRKLGGLSSNRENALSRAGAVVRQMAELIEGPDGRKDLLEVAVVEGSSSWERLEATAAPYLERLGVGSIVMILVFFLLLNREDMSDRIVRLFGQRRIGLTTRTMDEAGRRVSRYLGAFAAVNSAYGLVVGLGLWGIGVPQPALWGALAAGLRFIPYVGPAAAFAMPLLLSVVVSAGWREPILVVGLFGSLEVVASGLLEPIIYGKTTGVSTVGLLVAAMFWAWLWGPVGLLLSTPLTVGLAVMGKYVPGLGVFSTLLGEEPALEDPLRLYQRLLAVDRAAQRAVVDEAMRAGPAEAVFDAILIPVLAKAELDHARKEIGGEDRDLVWRAVDDMLDELEWKANLAPRLVEPGAVEGVSAPAPGAILALAAVDAADVLVLRMLNLLLASWGCGLEIVPGPVAPGGLVEFVAGRAPALVILSHLPPVGLSATRKLARLLREGSPGRPVMVGLWGAEPAEDRGRLSGDGLVRVVGTVAEARDRVLVAALPPAALAGLLERALLESDDARAGHLFEQIARDRPIDRLGAELIQPVLASIAAGHASGRIAPDRREHASRFFRRMLLPAVNEARRPQAGGRRVLLACPGSGKRDVGSMLLTLLLRARGWDVLDLGDDVPAGRIPEAADSFRPHLVVLSAAWDEAAGSLVPTALELARALSGPPLIALAAADFAEPGPGAGANPFPTLPGDSQARLAAIDRLVAASSRHD